MKTQKNKMETTEVYRASDVGEPFDGGLVTKEEVNRSHNKKDPRSLVKRAKYLSLVIPVASIVKKSINNYGPQYMRRAGVGLWAWTVLLHCVGMDGIARPNLIAVVKVVALKFKLLLFKHFCHMKVYIYLANSTETFLRLNMQPASSPTSNTHKYA
ncbi:hypothetical protein HELRODRAFT_162771 [Helobdella robusta]|uniref:Uncharacterized protein n=1 Tax=Helobdella robusta TaxID=6412 RepID=T1ET42_HELRO|nr:hypothetical protein HELRODRAFT_162771 [Helobdella robusta]ESN99253.1 hypothetical protein HELRODRAFT_162771 [Helobdella robusta]